uniref:EMAP like 1 n=1 Tax=Neogobius melanostomus TaxID=47308 RepID=A0A8C6TX88_9GOBI
SMEVTDRIASLEQRVQMQEDEIQLLKSALADVVRRLNMSEEQQALGPSLTRRDSGDAKRTRAGSTGSSSSGKRKEGYVKMFLKGRPVTMHMPKDQVDGYSLEARGELPPSRLKLHWVYGYRGRDCRSNLYLLPTGETVYFMASVVVLYNVDEQLQRHYTGHTDDIKCLAVHPDKITIATGQVAGTSSDGKQLPHVRIWDSVSLNTLHILGAGFFDRGLVCLAFSKSNGGNSLCAVDDSNDHVLSVWEWQREVRLAEVKVSPRASRNCEYPTNAVLIFHLCPFSLRTCTSGPWRRECCIVIVFLSQKHEKPKFVLCVTFAENGDTITGDSGGNILVWGKGTNRISQVIPGAHEGSIFALCMLRNGTLVSGGKDRRLVSWDSSLQQIQAVEVPEVFGPIRTIAEGRGDTVLMGTTKNLILQGSLDGEFVPITQGHMDELWGLAAHPSKPHFLTCGYDRQVCLWDSSSHQLMWVKTLEDTAQSAGFHPSGDVVAIGTHTGRWLVLDTESKDLVTVHTDGNEQLSTMQYGPDGNLLAVGSHDNYIYVYAVSEKGRKYSRVGKCSGHSSFITHLDWSVDSQYLVSNSGDYEILYWIPSVCKQVVSVETTRDIEWASHTCTLGFHVFGVWPDGSDGTDINASCSSRDKKLLVTGDDFGKVHLFSFPCSQFRAPSHVYGGHSSHVTNVSFLLDDSCLVSTGGKDMSIMQWRIV